MKKEVSFEDIAKMEDGSDIEIKKMDKRPSTKAQRESAEKMKVPVSRLLDISSIKAEFAELIAAHSEELSFKVELDSSKYAHEMEYNGKRMKFFIIVTE